MSAPGKRTVERYDYNSYIASPQWRATRDRYWASKMPKECWVCDAPRKPGMHLHHRTYKNLGNERLMDLVPVCGPCHEYIHQLAEEMYGGRTKNLWKATTSARRRRNPRFGSNATKARAASATRRTEQRASRKNGHSSQGAPRM